MIVNLNQKQMTKKDRIIKGIELLISDRYDVPVNVLHDCPLCGVCMHKGGDSIPRLTNWKTERQNKNDAKGAMR